MITTENLLKRHTVFLQGNCKEFTRSYTNLTRMNPAIMLKLYEDTAEPHYNEHFWTVGVRYTETHWKLHYVKFFFFL